MPLFYTLAEETNSSFTFVPQPLKLSDAVKTPVPPQE